MNCKNCFHNIICSANAYFKQIENVEQNCIHFKDKNKVMELQCEVGIIKRILEINERINYLKLQNGGKEEPLMTWQLYNILLKAVGITKETEHK